MSKKETKKILPPKDKTGNYRYDWVDVNMENLDRSQKHSINCRCEECCDIDDYFD